MISRREVDRNVLGALGVLLIGLALVLVGQAIAAEPTVCRVSYGALDGGTTRVPSWSADSGCRWYPNKAINDPVIQATVILMQCSTDVRFAVGPPLSDGGSTLVATANDLMAQFSTVNDPVQVSLAPGDRDIAVLNQAGDAGYCLFATGRERKIW